MTAAEDALRTSEERLGLLVQYSRDAVGSLDASTTITWISPVIEDLSGWKPEELIGRSAFELVHPDDLERGLRIAAEAFESGIGVDPVTLRFATASGDWLPLEISAGTVHDADGGVESIIVNLRDVSWRLEAEDALRRSERWFRALVQHSADAIMVIDESATVTYASPAVETVFGRRADEIVGTSGMEFLHPDDRDLVVTKLTEVFAAPGATARVEVRVQGGFEGWHWIEARAVNLADDDAVRGVVIHVRDITERLLSSKALAESEDRFKALLEHSTDVIVVTDREANVIYASPAIEHLFGRTADEVIGRQAGRLVHPDDLANVQAGTLEVYATPGAGTSLQLRVLDSQDRWRWIEANYTNLTHDARVGGVVVHIRDITDSRTALRESKRLTTIFEATNDLVGIADPHGDLLYLNAAARRFFGMAEHEDDDVTGFNLVQAFPPNVAERVSTEVSAVLEADDMWNGELALIRGDGQLVPVLAQLLVHRDADGAIEFFSGVLHDISERKQFESALAHQATHDPLTGLPNRSLLLDRLEGALARAKRHGFRVAVLFLDLDHFKVVNDSLGHELGDRLLVAIAERLQVALRPGDTIARFGGDEFVVLCEDLHGRNDAVAIAERVISAVSGPFVVDDAEVFVGLSIGIAFPSEDAEPGTLIRDADAAMYRAKERGRGRWEVFDNDLRASAVDRLDIENALRRSLDRRELRVYYQPIVQLDTGAISGVEALLRWEHSERGLLLPGDFIGIAEETGLIVPIGMWVLDQACRQVQRWQASIPAIPKLTVSVNLSGRQLGHPMLVDDVAAVLADTGLSPERLELEITESVLMDDVEASEETLRELDELGVRLVVDDFGTGYSSLSYLRRFPVDLLKVDREFVDGLHSDASDSAIVTAIVTLAHTLGMEAVAEGVETPEQLEELRSVGCDKAQGFLIAKPSAGDDIAELLEARPYW